MIYLTGLGFSIYILIGIFNNALSYFELGILLGILVIDLTLKNINLKIK